MLWLRLWSDFPGLSKLVNKPSVGVAKTQKVGWVGVGAGIIINLILKLRKEKNRPPPISGDNFFGFHNLPQIFLALALMEAANDISRNDTLGENESKENSSSNKNKLDNV